MTIPENMLGLVLKEDGYASGVLSSTIESLDPYLEKKTIATPKPGPGQVLVRVRMASLNPSDIAFIKGVYGQARVAGVPAGFEAVGQVVASGGGFLANRLKGKRVAFFAGISGAWAGYAVAEAKTCLPVRATVSDENAAAMLVNPFSVWAMQEMIEREAVKSFVLTAGASQLCKLLVGLARDKGYRPICLVRRDEQMVALKKLGAAHVLNTEAADFSKSLKAVLGEEKPRFLFDALCSPLSQSVFQAMGRKSRWVVYGGLDFQPTLLPDPGQLIFQSKQVEGFWLTSWLQRKSLLQKLMASNGVQSRFASGAWNTDIAAHIPLAEAHARLPEYLTGANPGKVMFVP